MFSDVILTRSGSLDTSHKVWMTPHPKREDKSG